MVGEDTVCSICRWFDHMDHMKCGDFGVWWSGNGCGKQWGDVEKCCGDVVVE
jgi:hypothetical protein